MNTIVPMNNLTADTGRGPSPALWANFPSLEIIKYPERGTYRFTDFDNAGLLTSPTTEAALVGLGLSGFGSDAGSATAGISFGNATYSTTTNDAGTLILSNTTVNHATSVRSAVTPYRMSKGYGFLAWEARLKINTVATNEVAFFAGFMEDTALTVNVPLLAGSTFALADKNVVALHKPVANTTTFNSTYKADGVTAGVVNTGIGALVADTYVKIGMTFNQFGDNKLYFYVNNLRQGTGKVVPDNTGTDFPADKALGWAIAMAVGSGASDDSMTIDWVCEGQRFNF